MDISYWTMPGGFNTTTGYGYAGFNIVNALKALGHSVPYASKTAPVRFAFCQPQYYKQQPGQYFIGYTPWESTELPEGWVDMFNECDELWTTSEWVRQVYLTAGVTVPIYVYPHGITKDWTAVHRKPVGRTKFLHIGEPAPRKAGQLTFESFREAFGDRVDVSLTIKAHQFSTIRTYDSQGSLSGLPNKHSNVDLVTLELGQEKLIQLVHDHDVLVYPSWGEGFGFIPAQALATGMPTICTSAWAPYAEYLDGLALDSRLVDSPWVPPHDGKMYEPSQHHLIQLMRDAVDNFDKHSETFYNQAEWFQQDYDWVTVTRNAFARIEAMFS